MQPPSGDGGAGAGDRRASQQALRQDFYPVQPRMGLGHTSPPPLPVYGGPPQHPTTGARAGLYPSVAPSGADDFAGEDGNDVLGDIAVTMVVTPRSAGGAGPRVRPCPIPCPHCPGRLR